MHHAYVKSPVFNFWPARRALQLRSRIDPKTARACTGWRFAMPRVAQRKVALHRSTSCFAVLDYCAVREDRRCISNDRLTHSVCLVPSDRSCFSCSRAATWDGLQPISACTFGRNAFRRAGRGRRRSFLLSRLINGVRIRATIYERATFSFVSSARAFLRVVEPGAAQWPIT